MNFKSIFFYLSITFLIVAGVAATLFIQETIDYKAAKERYAESLFFKDRLFAPEEWSGEQAANPFVLKAQEQQRGIDKHRSAVQQKLLILLGILLAYIAYTLFLYARNKNAKVLSFGMICVAMICLYAGLFSPMLEIAAYERNLDLGNIPIKTKVLGMEVDFQLKKQFKGDLYFFYQSKSIVELIQLLFQQRNWVVGVSILMFSVLFPVSKVLLSLVRIFRSRPLESKWSKFWLLKSGKWSMADVFVVAVFLSYLAFNSMQIGVQTESKALPGLYFFLAYCILSIGSSGLITSEEHS
ncbi:MAG: paraquat-inducible protein A [Saprospiraceae bacterium]|nr:paraquat-inducible protein A [Saprospiraceae bacterium]